MIWIAMALMTGVAVVSLLWPLTGPAPRAQAESADVAYYRAQIAEIDAETARGEIDGPQAETARALAARRLLSVAGETMRAPEETARAPWLAALLIAIGAPALALGLYAKTGHPNLPDQPLQVRLETPAASPDLSAAVGKMEAFLKDHSDDGRAPELATSAYLEMGRYDDAVAAMRKSIALQGESPDRLVKYAEALSYANDGVVSPEAVDQLERALTLDPKNLQARYFLGLAAAQHDDGDKAREVWSAMLPEMPEGSQAKRNVMEKLALLDAPVEGATQPAASANEGRKTVEAMVEHLAQRLAAQGGSADDWIRLIRSYRALGKAAPAQDAYEQARQIFASDDVSRRKFATLAEELGLNVR